MQTHRQAQSFRCHHHGTVKNIIGGIEKPVNSRRNKSKAIFPIAAVGLGQLLAFIATTLVSGLSVGTNVIVAQLWGAKRHREAGEAARHFLGLSVAVSLALTACGLLLSSYAMHLLGAAPDVIALSLPYSTLIFLVIPFTVLLQVLSSILQGTGDTKSPMYAMIVVNLLHVAIAYPLIYGRWGLPALGVKGAGVAIGIAEATGASYLLFRCLSLLQSTRSITEIDVIILISFDEIHKNLLIAIVLQTKWSN